MEDQRGLMVRFRRLFQFSSFPSFRVWVLVCFLALGFLSSLILWLFFFVCLFFPERNISVILKKSEKPSDPSVNWLYLSYGLFTVLACFGFFFSCRGKYIRFVSFSLAAFKILQASWNEVVDSGKKLNFNSSVG